MEGLDLMPRRTGKTKSPAVLEFEKQTGTDLGAVFRVYRENLEMSVPELAEAVDASEAMIYQIENGLTLPGLSMFARLCDALCVCSDLVFDGMATP
jgi:DNA-binding XRE family transcriptional regulator